MLNALNRLEQSSELAGANHALQALLDDSLDQLRSAMRTLRAEVCPLGVDAVRSTDLYRGLGQMVTDARAAGLTVEARIDPTIADHVQPASVAHVLHVVREALSNALRHASALRVAVRAQAEGRRLVLCVSDDGVGFDVNGRRGQGLAAMQMRAEAAGGLLQVESATGAGTIVTLTLPLRA